MPSRRNLQLLEAARIRYGEMNRRTLEFLALLDAGAERTAHKIGSYLTPERASPPNDLYGFLRTNEYRPLMSGLTSRN